MIDARDAAVALYREQRDGRRAAWADLVTKWEAEDIALKAAREAVRAQHEQGERDHDASFVAVWGAVPADEAAPDAATEGVATKPEPADNAPPAPAADPDSADPGEAPMTELMPVAAAADPDPSDTA